MDLFFDNEFRNLIPSLQVDERRHLEESLVSEGNRDPIVIWKETRLLLDGHNRYDICTSRNIPLKPAIEISLASRDDAKIWIIRNQFGKRNLSPYSRSVLALKLEELIAAKARESYKEKVGRPTKSEQNSAPINHVETRVELAKVARVSHDTITKVKTIEARGTSEQKTRLVAGTATVNQIFTQLKREEVKNKVKNTKWPSGKYRILYADPPWTYDNETTDHSTMPSDYYPTMSLADIKKLPIETISLENSVLFLWATAPMIQEALEVICSWGFLYKAQFIWDKIKHNMGNYNSVRHELLLIGTRGTCMPDINELFDSVQSIERQGHSHKPEEFRVIIDKMYPYGPRIELFSRVRVEGWDVYGNQIG